MYFGLKDGNATARLVSCENRREINYSYLKKIYWSTGDDASAEKRSKQMAKCAASTSGEWHPLNHELII